MSDELRLGELIAGVLRKGRGILIFALLFALLTGGVQLYRMEELARAPENSEEKIEERYQLALEEYELRRKELQNDIEQQTKKLETRKEYRENSLYINLDPYNRWTSQIIFSIADIDPAASEDVRYTNTSADYAASRILSRYMSYWNIIDLPKELGVAGLKSMEEKYLREVVNVSDYGGGLICIYAYGDSATEADNLTNAAYSLLASQRDVVAKSAYAHDFAVVSRSTKSVIDTGLEATVKALDDELLGYETAIENDHKALEELGAPSRESVYSAGTIAKSVIKHFLGGVLVGAFVGCAVACIGVIARNTLQSSYQLKRSFDLAFVGTMTKERTLFAKCAEIFGGERRWKDEVQAQSFTIQKALKLLEGKKSVLLASTLESEKARQAYLDTLEAALAQKGIKARSMADFSRNPNAMDELAGSEAVLLMERLDATKLGAVSDAVDLAKTMDVPVIGVVLT